jgi:hypothetical protein
MKLTMTFIMDRIQQTPCTSCLESGW